MIDMDWKVKMAAPEISVRSPPRLSPQLHPRQLHPPYDAAAPSNSSSPFSPRPASSSATSAYEHYLRLPELSKLWTSRDFPDWKAEPVLKPALQALEITFRFVSLALSDPRPYANRREWARRLESLATHQIELIAALCEDDGGVGPGAAPTADLGTSKGMLMRDRSSQEVWKLPGATPVVSRTSEASLLARLAAWDTSEAVATKILFEIECQMRRAPFTLGLGEPNLAGKPYLEYDLVCRPADLHALKKTPVDSRGLRNHENGNLYTAHQLLESWVCSARELLRRIGERIDAEEWEGAASDCWLLERIWKLFSEIEDLHLLMDPDDFLRLKNQLAIKAPSLGSEAFCFRSTALIELTRSSKDLRRRVPAILRVEADPNGGPRVQEAAMGLFHSQRRGTDGAAPAGKIHLLQALQAVEAAVKKFFFSYRQLIVAAMGSLEASGNRAVVVGFAGEDPHPPDSLTQLFLEPPYFPSLDAAKTFLGEFWHHHHHEHHDAGSRTRR